MELVPEIYRLTARFPREELFGLAAQMRRAAISIPSNIAEGAARTGSRELLHYLAMAAASASELDTQLEIAARLGYLKDGSGEVVARLDDVSEQIVRVVAQLRRRSKA